MAETTTHRIWVELPSGTYGDATGIRFATVTQADLEYLENASDDEISNFGETHGLPPAKPAAPAELLYTKCAECHLFVDSNPSHEDDPDAGYAPWLHMHRGDDPDTRLDESHEATPSPFKATLATWRVFGPSQMRERFIDLETGVPYTD